MSRASSSPAPSDVTWLAEHLSEADGGVAFRIGRAGDTVVAEWVGLARLSARRDGSASELVPEPGADPADLEKVRRGSAALLLRHLRGELAFHGAAVEIGGRALVLLGRSGQGKSTLAAKLCARAGATLLADDAVALDRAAPGAFEVRRLEENHWLDEGARAALGFAGVDESEGKSPTRAARLGPSAVPLAAFVELAYEDVTEPRIRSIGGTVAALAALVPQAVRFVLDEPEMQRAELDELVQIATCVPVLVLERPRGYDALDRTVDLMVTAAKDLGATT